MTYLELVNEVLQRLRESTVSSVTVSPYSTLIGHFVNDAKRQVEDSWNWDALSTTIPVTTSPGVSTYTVTGSGRRQKDVSVNNVTNRATVNNAPIKWIQDQQQLSQVQQGQPVYYAWNGSDGTDSKVEVYPTPDGVYSLSFNMVVPQISLVNNSDIISVPAEPVIAGAFARALVERGEDGGLTSGEAYGLYKGVLADYIAIEKERYIENDCWVAN
jgi:hypothetical protein